MKAKIIQNIKSIILALILMLGVGVVSAVGTWKNPDCGPTGCNTDTPINVSDTIQTKDGGLILGGGLVTGRLNPPYGLIVEKGNVGIGTAAPTRKLTVDIGSPNIDRDGIQISGNTLNIGLFLENKRTSGTPLWSITSAASGSGFGAGNLVIQRQLSGEQWYGNPDLTSAVFTPSGNMGIGTNAPGAKLEVAGQVKITGGIPGAGKVLTSDANGLASWQTPATSGTSGEGSSLGNLPSGILAGYCKNSNYSRGGTTTFSCSDAIFPGVCQITNPIGCTCASGFTMKTVESYSTGGGELITTSESINVCIKN